MAGLTDLTRLLVAGPLDLGIGLEADGQNSDHRCLCQAQVPPDGGISAHDD